MMKALPSGYDLRETADATAAHAFLTRSYWAEGISLDIVERAIAGSFVVSVLHDGAQIAMARLVTDYATFGYLADVYVLEDHRRLGIAEVMLATLQSHPRLQGFRRWLLATKDMHAVYAKMGWEPMLRPERLMERLFLDIYPPR
jgi:GNAT superfamily N-acetyltransferase